MKGDVILNREEYRDFKDYEMIANRHVNIIRCSCGRLRADGWICTRCDKDTSN